MPVGKKAAIAALMNGDEIFVQLPGSNAETEGLQFYLKKAARRIRNTAILALQADLVPVGDGLLEGATQSYRLRPDYQPPAPKKRKAAK